MRPRSVLVAPVDIALLERIGRAGSVVAAARELGISRDRAVYRLTRLSTALGRPVTTGRRGGSRAGSTSLTDAGLAALRRGSDLLLAGERGVSGPARSGTRLEGTYRGGREPRVVVGGSLELRVAFAAEDGGRVAVEIEPEAVLLALSKVPSSARNRWSGSVTRVIRPGGKDGAGQRAVDVDIGGRVLRAAVTSEAVRALRLERGRRVVVLVKATAVRRVPLEATLGSPRR